MQRDSLTETLFSLTLYEQNKRTKKMNWTELIKAEMAQTYNSTEKLIAMVEDSKLNWKPTTGSNWMTTGQLLCHIPDACGTCFKGFYTGDWGGTDVEGDVPVQEMLPPAEKLPSVSSVAEALERLAKDKELAHSILAQAGEEELATRMVTAPWNPQPMLLGHQLLGMVAHLEMHKNQLYYYLKLQGHPVNTMHMFGMV
jgi:uncharacterized damage-inducible protein DinB